MNEVVDATLPSGTSALRRAILGGAIALCGMIVGSDAEGRALFQQVEMHAAPRLSRTASTEIRRKATALSWTRHAQRAFARSGQ
ncbi:MAG: hypothetical protein WDN04_25110 [Rhodospirillales bacterium]